jgi:hypothetical protein
MAPPRKGTLPTTLRISRQLKSDLDAWIKAQPNPQPTRPEAIRRLLTERLADQPAPAAAPTPLPRGSTEGDADLAELRRKFIMLAGKVDGLVAYTRQVEAQRDALAARAPRLEIVREPPRPPPNVERWPRGPPHSPSRDGLLLAPATLSRESTPRDDPEAVARARAQLAAAEAAAEARRREESEAPRD